jgi:hypothetical protein
MIIVPPCTQQAADTALRTLPRHVPATETIGEPISASLIPDDIGRLVCIQTQTGNWYVRSYAVRRLRRIDSELAEPWDLTAGTVEITPFVEGHTFPAMTVEVGSDDWNRLR